MIPRTWLSSAGRLAFRGGRVALAGYLLVLLLLLFFENTLLYPAPRYPNGDWTAAEIAHEDVFFASADGTKLHGWYLEHAAPRAVMLYAHGNGDCVAYLGPYLGELRDELRVSVFVFDYRGYGRSEGSPIEQGILEDGDAAHRWLAERTGKQLNEIVLMGRSLGGAVAVHLADRNGARGLVLQNTWTSLPDAAARLYPWAPVRWLMRNRYESLAKIAGYSGPLLSSHGTADELVPIDLGRQLFDAAPTSQKEFFMIEGGNHNTPEPREYYRALDRWIDELPR
ncbi:MAG: alpha/beta hydrolase [Planctomycetaceae bacterium]|nr:alpha/beta hydrolase [Planctomycetaceae bacterium]